MAPNTQQSPPDLASAIDVVWPQLRAAQRRGWQRIFVALLAIVAVVVAFLLLLNDSMARIVVVGGAIVLIGYAIHTHFKISKTGAPLIPQILLLAGFAQTDKGAHSENYAKRGLLPLRGSLHPGDHLVCDLGPHRLERIAARVSRVKRDSDGDRKTIVYFHGDLFRINNLPRVSPGQLVVRIDRSKGSREITSRFASHADPAWRSRNRTELVGVGQVMQSPDGRCVNLLKTLKAISPHFPSQRAFFSALRENDSIVIALSGGAPSLSVGGLVMSRYSVEQKVDKILGDLTQTLVLAQAIIASETAPTESP